MCMFHRSHRLPRARKKSTAEYIGPKSELRGIDMVYSDSARAMLRMVTEQQITTLSEDRVYPKEMKLWFYDKLGNITSQIRGDSAHFSDKAIPIN